MNLKFKKLIETNKESLRLFIINLKLELEDSKEGLEILNNWIENKEISKSDIKFLRNKSKDSLKILGLTGIIILPFGSLLLVFILNASKKLGIDIIPNNFKKN